MMMMTKWFGVAAVSIFATGCASDELVKRLARAEQRVSQLEAADSQIRAELSQARREIGEATAITRRLTIRNVGNQPMIEVK